MRSETLETIKQKNGLIDQIKEVDFWMLTMTIALAMYGLIMVFSASYYFSINENGNPFYYLIRDGIWVVLGTALMCFGIVVDYRTWNNKVLIEAQERAKMIIRKNIVALGEMSGKHYTVVFTDPSDS